MSSLFKKSILFFLFIFLKLPSFSQDILTTNLFNAVVSNKKEEAKNLVIKGANINYVDSNGASLLMWAAYKADIDLFIWLHKNGASLVGKGVIYLDTLKSYYGSLLCIASGEGKIDLLSYLTEDCKLDINEPEYNPDSNQKKGWAPITWAVSKGNFNIVKLLTQKGANINAEPNLLELAKEKNYLNISRHFKANGLKLKSNTDFKTILPTAPAGLFQLYPTESKKYLIGYGIVESSFYIWNSKTLELIQRFPVPELSISSCYSEKDNIVYYIGLSGKDSSVNIYGLDFSINKKFLLYKYDMKVDEPMGLKIILSKDNLFFQMKEMVLSYSLTDKTIDTAFVSVSRINDIILNPISNKLVIQEEARVVQLDIKNFTISNRLFHLTGKNVKKIIVVENDNKIALLEKNKISVLNNVLALDYLIPIDSTLEFEELGSIDTGFILLSKNEIRFVAKSGYQETIFMMKNAIYDYLKTKKIPQFPIATLDKTSFAFIADWSLGSIYKLNFITHKLVNNKDEIAISATYKFNKSKNFIVKNDKILYSLRDMRNIEIPGVKDSKLYFLNDEIFAAYDTSQVTFFELQYSECYLLKKVKVKNISIVQRIYGNWDCLIYTKDGKFYVYKLLGNKIKVLDMQANINIRAKALFPSKANKFFTLDSNGKIFSHLIEKNADSINIKSVATEIELPQKPSNIDIQNDLVVFSDSSSVVYAYKINTGKLIKIWSPRYELDFIQDIKISKEGDFIILTTSIFSNRIIVIDILKSDMYSKTMSEPIVGVDIADSIIIVNGISGLSKYLNITSLKSEYELCTTYMEDILFLKDNYFATFSKRLNKLIGFSNNQLDHITFDQLDIKYNRPDKVLEAIGSTDTALIESYRNAYYKRIKKLGIDTTSFKEGFTIPEADFKNRDAIEYEQITKQLKLQISGKSTENLDRFNIWVNEVPLYGQKGINLRSKNQKNFDTTLSINLSEGDNSIETSITDVNGIESYHQPLIVKYIPEKKQLAKTYFIGIGINRFADSSNNLSWSVKDIRDLATKFGSKNAVIDTLFDENVTKENIVALKNKLLTTNEEDKVIIAYSGHGLLSKEYDYYLSTYPVNFTQPEQSGLPYDELENLLNGIKARKKLMLIDACHSGEVDKDEMKNYTVAKDSLDIQGVKGIILENTGENKLGMKNSFEVMQELFVNVGRGTGATIISAAAGTQFALERGDLKNGVFTYCLLEVMNSNSTIKISDLKKVVTGKVPLLTGGLQKPTFRAETQQFDWELW